MKMLARQLATRFPATLRAHAIAWLSRPAISPLRRRVGIGSACWQVAGIGRQRWQGLRLQWRRLPPAALPGTGTAARSVTNQHWSTQIHLHFGPQQNAMHPTSLSRASSLADNGMAGRGHGRSASSALSALAPDAARQHGRHLPQSTANSQHRATRLATSYARPQTGLIAANRMPAESPPLIAAARRPPLVHALWPQPAGHLASHPGAPTPARRGTALAAPAAIALSWKPKMPAAQAAQNLLRASEPEAIPTPASAHWSPHSTQMVWRKPASATGQPTTPQGAPDSEIANTASSSTSAATKAQKTAAPAPTPAAIAAQLRAALPDPVLTERLATEVIRRVERTLRIERERRGH